MRSILFAGVLAVGCGSPPPVTPRFANAPPVKLVNDRENVPVAPKARPVLVDYYAYQALFARRISRPFELPRARRAYGVNSIDEVPDSTWFTNRSALTPAQIATGPLTIESPEAHVPWTILSTQAGGTSNGFIIQDARGIKYLLKFDDVDFPEVETGADVIVNRLLWACGYNVPEDQVVYLRPDQLVIAPDAIEKDAFNRNRGKLDRHGVDARLAKVAHERDGRIRALTSRWLAGKPLGPPPTEGVRGDDPNDLIPHEHRRDQRGKFPIYAWLDVGDLVPGNFLDMYVDDPADATRHYVKHYQLDFGRSLGVMGTKTFDLERGYNYRIDIAGVFARLFALGIAQPDWVDRPRVEIQGVPQLFSAGGFEPGDWKPDLPYTPFDEMDRFDALWGAKLVARFTRPQIEAAVDAARFTDPRARDYMVETLVARQRKVAAYWYDRVQPLERFEAGDGLCFDDLAVAQGYASAPATLYRLTPVDANGHPMAGGIEIAAAADGHTCAPLPQVAAPGYSIVEVRTIRPGFHGGTTHVHVQADHVIGVWRN